MAYKFDFTIKSSSFRDGVIKSPEGEVLLDMREDRRVDDIEAITRTAMHKNGWKLPENEKEISEKVKELMHKREFYGPYSDKSRGMQVALGEIQSKISEIELNKDRPEFQKETGKTEKQLDKQLEELRKQETQSKETLNNDSGIRNRVPLKHVKSGETVCFHQASIMSHIMDRLGSENDLCFGILDGNVDIGMHAFVQSREGKKNIIDPTMPISYWHNLNGADIRDGEIVRGYENEMGGPGTRLLNYGGGKTPNLLEWLFPDRYLKDEIEDNKPKTTYEYAQTYLEANTHRANNEKLTFVLPKDVSQEVRDLMKSFDKGWLGRGTISGKELEEAAKSLTDKQIDLLENAGVSLSGSSSYKLEETNCNGGNHKHGSPNHR